MRVFHRNISHHRNASLLWNLSIQGYTPILWRVSDPRFWNVPNCLFFWTISDWTAENFSSLFFFCFFLLCIIPYLARDSCKKWQEKLSRLGLISRVDSQIFLVTILFFCFCFLIILGKLDLSRVDSRKFLVTIFFFVFFSSSLFWETGPFRIGQLKISRHFFVFVFLLLSIILYLARGSCKKWQEKLSRLGLISRVDGRIFLVTILFFVYFFFFLSIILYLARDSCKKWQEIINKPSLISHIEQKTRNQIAKQKPKKKTTFYHYDKIVKTATINKPPLWVESLYPFRVSLMRKTPFLLLLSKWWHVNCSRERHL